MKLLAFLKKIKLIDLEIHFQVLWKRNFCINLQRLNFPVYQAASLKEKKVVKFKYFN